MRVNLHVYPSDMTHESRIERETALIESLNLFDEVQVAGIQGEGLPSSESWGRNREVHRLASSDKSQYWLGGIGKTIAFSRQLLSRYSQEPIAVINCHSVAVLPVCIELKRRTGAALIYDTHELETESASAKGAKRYLYRLIERLGIRATDHILVVTDSIADWYREKYGVSAVDSLYNYPSVTQIRSGLPRGYFQKKFELSDKARIFLYQGLLADGRGLEQIAEAFASPRNKRDYVVFLGFGAWEAKVRDWSRHYPNILFHPPVPLEDLAALTREADVGLVLTEGSYSISYLMSAPNKLFQYWHGGLPAIVSDIPEHRRYLAKYPAGIVVRGTSGAALQDAIEDLNTTKNVNAITGAIAEARNDLRWEIYAKRLREVLERLLDQGDENE